MWHPISQGELEALIAQELAQCPQEQLETFAQLRVAPQKWQLEPWGNEGGGFWVVAKTPELVVWYNDIEEGFNTSSYATEGVIGEYWCNQDPLWRALYATRHPIVKLSGPEPIG